MEKNIFFKEQRMLGLREYMEYSTAGRGNLGDSVPLAVYRLLEYSLRQTLEEHYGKETQIAVMRDAGRRAGRYFAENILDLSLPFGSFVAQLQEKLAEMRIGVLKIESFDEESGKLVLTVSEDADCSGLPVLGETVCNYDEGFIGGVLSVYTKKTYQAIEVDCWATGDRVCRFHADVVE